MRDKDSDNIYQLYNEGSVDLHCEAVPALAAAATGAAAAAARYGPRVYKALRGGGVPKGVARPLVKGPGAGLAGGSALGGGNRHQAFNPETGRLQSQFQGKPHAGTGLGANAGDQEGTTQQQQPAQQPAKPVKMMGIELDQATAQSLYDQLGRALGKSSGIEKDEPAETNADTNDAVDQATSKSFIANRGKYGFDSSNAGA